MGALKVTKENFEKEVLKSPLPVLVDFWAEWCGPCRVMGPIIDEIAGDLAGRLKVAKVNVDEAQELAAGYGIMSIPSFLLFKKGEVVDQIVGAMPKQHLIQKITPHI